MTSVAVVVAVAMLGVLLGPAARGVIVAHSVAWGEPWQDQCPHCRHRLAATRLPFALLSTMGRCGSCRHRIGPPPVIVEMTLGAVFGLLAWRITQPLPLIAFCWMAAIGACLAFIDIAVHRLPTRLIGTSMAGGTAGLTLTAIVGHDLRHILLAVAMSAAAAAVYLLLAIFGGYGMGDMRFAFVLGLATGWFGLGSTLVALFAAAALTAAAGLAIVAFGQPVRRRLPHGPFMAIGAMVAVLLPAAAGL